MKRVTQFIALLSCSIFLALSGCNTANQTIKNCGTNHSWELTFTTATCLSPGEETYTCRECKETKTESVEAYGHNLVQSSYTAPTCKTTGSKIFVCARCGYSETETLLTIDCDYQVKSTTPSTCTEKGSQLWECSMCHKQKTETLPLEEHDFHLIRTVPSTCVIQGRKEYQCKNCPATKMEDLPLARHQYQRITVQANCFVHGGQRDICSTCGDTQIITDITVSHDWGDDGYCTHCGIYKTLFDADGLNFQRQGGLNHYLTVIYGNLPQKFNVPNKSIPVSYWENHTVSMAVTLYNEYHVSLGSKTYTSDNYLESGDVRITNMYSAGNFALPNTFSIDFERDDFNRFTSQQLSQCKFVKLTISCEGYETIEKTFDVSFG